LKKRIISIETSIGQRQGFVADLMRMGRANTKGYVCLAQVHMLVEAWKDEDYAKVVNEAAIVVPNGMPVAMAVKILHGVPQQRLSGVELLPELFKAAQAEQLSIFFVGGTRTLLDYTWEYCTQQFPDLDIAGTYCPKSKIISGEESLEIIDKIEKARPNFVVVTLDCPEQEKWMAAVSGKIKACMLGVGSALPIAIGVRRKAPSWMQRTSLEWLYRLSEQPFRLFMRYAISNTVFLLLLLKFWSKAKLRQVG